MGMRVAFLQLSALSWTKLLKATLFSSACTFTFAAQLECRSVHLIYAKDFNSASNPFGKPFAVDLLRNEAH